MTSWRPYLWKEFRENRRLGLTSFGVFVGIGLIPPLIDAARFPEKANWRDGYAFLVMLLGGPVLAIVAGVHAWGREQGAIARFWGAQPIDWPRWLLSKYVTGLALIGLVCWVPLLWAHAWGPSGDPNYSPPDAIAMSLAYSLILLLIYSISFTLGQCIRGVVRAAGATALIILMPLVVQPLTWLSVIVLGRIEEHTLSGRSYAAFATAMAGLSLAMLGLAGIFFRRRLRIDADRRTLGWSLALISLVLAAGAVFPIGESLSAQQVIPLPVTQESRVCDMATDGNNVLVLFSRRTAPGSSKERQYGLVGVHVGGRKTTMQEPVWFDDPGQRQNLYHTSAAPDLVWSTENPSLAYLIVTRTDWPDRTAREQTHTLYTIALDPRRAESRVHHVELDPLLGASVAYLTSCVYRQRLYIYSEEYSNVRLLTFSLANPEAPSLIENDVSMRRISWQPDRVSDRYRIQLTSIPHLEDSARLEITHDLARGTWVPAGDGRILLSRRDPSSPAPRLVLCQADPAQDGVLPLRPVAQHRSAIIEALFGSYGDLYYSDGLAYQPTGRSVSVYRIDDVGHVARVGHYAVDENLTAVAPLPHHRVMIGGQRLHVLDLSDRVSR